ncbi:DUF4352 domain-containing protein [Streptomyces sp. NPDC004237]|uniref:DUF4352 domain-containing protein n=1 Tax=Streptomyces sp. NPDC004237 TaxID=3154455 RepID=UPI0033B616EC
MKTRIAACTALLALTAALTACSSDADPKPTATATQTAPASPSPSPAAADTTLKLGTVKTIDDDTNDVHITIQAVEYQQPYKGPQPQKPDKALGGDTWSTVNVKVCNVSGPDINVSQHPWSLDYADGTSIETTGLSGGDMPKPEFPMDKAVKAGRCAAGLIPFPVPSSKQPARVVYAPDGTEPTEWAVAAS